MQWQEWLKENQFFFIQTGSMYILHKFWQSLKDNINKNEISWVTEVWWWRGFKCHFGRNKEKQNTDDFEKRRIFTTKIDLKRMKKSDKLLPPPETKVYMYSWKTWLDCCNLAEDRITIRVESKPFLKRRRWWSCTLAQCRSLGSPRGLVEGWVYRTNHSSVAGRV